MAEYIANRFAEILTKGDAYQLFNMLQGKYGTIASACERIGIERRTFYHWRNARQINIETKRKLLKVAIQEHPIETLKFLTVKAKERTTEISSHLIETLRRHIIEEENPEKLKTLITTTKAIISQLSIPIIENIHHEVENLLKLIDEKSLKLGIIHYEKSKITYHFKFESMIIEGISTAATFYFKTTPEHESKLQEHSFLMLIEQSYERW